MLVIGSRALVHNNPELAETRVCGDWDFIATIDQFNKWYKANKSEMAFAVPTDGGKYYHCRGKDGMNYEFEIAWEDTSAAMLLGAYTYEGEKAYAINADLLAIKMSHRYKKNSVHFKKTMDDIRFLRKKLKDSQLDPWLYEFVRLREKETYTYSHPALNVDKGSFFKDDGVQYVYDHDDLHKVVAIEESPAYAKYIKDGQEVLTSSEKFWAVDQRTRLLGGLEESMVLALERSQIPHAIGREGGPTPRWSFEMALMKVCTSITSGYFREFCWEHYNEIMAMYDELGEFWYTNKFKEAASNGEILPRHL